MKKIQILALALTTLLLMSCGGDDETDDRSTPKTTTSKERAISYEFEVNGCNTGEHKFSSLEALCEGLKDDTRNNGCARQLRREAFEANCEGAFE